MASTTNHQPKLTYTQRQGTSQFFNEPLGKDLALKMILIPAGTFLMGSPEDELERRDSEGPQHEVNVAAFCMGKYPITQAQWRFVARLPQVEQALSPAPSMFTGDTLPVETVSWYNAVEFCARLFAYTKRPYRLPSEAEWEYTCRAGTTTPFYFGETITTEVANYNGTDSQDGKWSGSYGRGLKGEYRQKTTPVEHFGSANPFGLCDMHGNIWEWCQDHWHSNYERAPTDESAWLSEDKDARRVRRGGSWSLYPGYCRSGCRYSSDPRVPTDYLGFRVACSFPRTFK